MQNPQFQWKLELGTYKDFQDWSNVKVKRSAVKTAIR